MTGENFLQMITNQLIRFRKNPIITVADLKQMYLNVDVSESDKKYQRSIINFKGEKVKIIEYNSLIFESKCAPYLAVKIIHK